MADGYDRRSAIGSNLAAVRLRRLQA